MAFKKSALHVLWEGLFTVPGVLVQNPNKITKIESELFLDHPNEEDASFDFDSVGQFNWPVALQQ